MSCYTHPQNGDDIMTIDSVTSLHPLYKILVMIIITSGVLGGIRGYTAYTNLRGFLTAYTHLSDHK